MVAEARRLRYEQNVPTKEIAARLDVSESSVSEYAPGDRAKRDLDTERRVVGLAAAGNTQTEIMGLTGLHRDVVSRAIRRAQAEGSTPPPRPPLHLTAMGAGGNGEEKSLEKRVLRALCDAEGGYADSVVLLAAIRRPDDNFSLHNVQHVLWQLRKRDLLRFDVDRGRPGTQRHRNIVATNRTYTELGLPLPIRPADATDVEQAADKIERGLKRGPATREDLRNLFGRHITVALLDAALAALERAGRAVLNPKGARQVWALPDPLASLSTERLTEIAKTISPEPELPALGTILTNTLAIGAMLDAERAKEAAEVTDVAEEVRATAARVWEEGHRWPLLALLRTRERERKANGIKVQKLLDAAALVEDVDADVSADLLRRATEMEGTPLLPIEAEYLAYSRDNGASSK